jgi:hydrogenase maturation protease
LGNPIRGDDGVGLRVAQALESRLNQEQEVTVIEASVAGLDFLDLLSDHDRVIIIDAIQTKDGKAGQIYRLQPEALNATRHTATPHDLDFASVLELSKKLGLALPKEIIIFGVEVKDVNSFSEKCTPEVEKAIPDCVEMVIQELNESHG